MNYYSQNDPNIREIRQNSENVSPVSRKQHERHDHTIDPMEGCSNTAKPILRKVLERSKFVEIHDNSENVVQNLVSVEPSEGCSVTADPVSRLAYQEFQVRPNEMIVHMVHTEESDNQDELLMTTEEEKILEEKHIGRRIVNDCHREQQASLPH
ncbi:hypothetical protein O0L34_g9535 [Tuta absoluta]|nr:hypothetical protein O0L34_g9535 [Tuta absoluta]